MMSLGTVGSERIVQGQTQSTSRDSIDQTKQALSAIGWVAHSYGVSTKLPQSPFSTSLV